MAQAPAASSTDVAASLVLLGSAVAAIVVANSGLAYTYKGVLDTSLTIGLGEFAITDTVKTWIKNALMAVFFVLVGLEIKAEFTEGALSDRARAVLPFAGALGGMLMPAVIYLFFVWGDPTLVGGWAIPCATDIAFAVGIVGLLGKRVPVALKAFLLAVAVIDDLGAILIIAFFYTESLNGAALGVSGAILGVLFVMNRLGVTSLPAYLAVGVALWIAVYQSGINPTLAGVATALFVPLRGKEGKGSPLHDLVDLLKFPVVFVIMPIFAFANAGVPILGLSLEQLAMPVTLAIAAGLLIGKPIGITAFVLLATRSKLARLPDGVSLGQVIGVGFIAGIGFTMSLFIGTLAFTDPAMMDQVRLGVLLGSTLAAIAGVVLLILSARAAPKPARA